MRLTPQVIREQTAIQLAKDSGKRLIFQVGDNIWNVVDVKTGAAVPVRTFAGACMVAANFKSIVIDLQLEEYAGQLLARTIKCSPKQN